MPFLLIRNDITKIQADAVVNPANPNLAQGSGTSRAIYLAAGEKQLTDACSRIGHCEPGKAVITPAFSLPAKYIIHAVCPAWADGNSGEEELLYGAYTEAMRLAWEHGLRSVAFPLLSAGNYGFPKETAMKTAVHAISDFLLEHDMTVSLVLYDRQSVSVSKKLFASVKEYIDDHYVEAKDESFPGIRGYQRGRRSEAFPAASETPSLSAPEGMSGSPASEAPSFPAPEGMSGSPASEAPGFPAPEGMSGSLASETPGFPAPEGMSGSPALEAPGFPAPEKMPGSPGSVPAASGDAVGAAPDFMLPKRDLDDLLRHRDETFSQMLLRLIDERGMKDSEVYRRANIDRRHFSKIRNDVNYCPGKKTVLAFAVALELSLDETRDLLMRAGFTFSRSSRFDIIVQYFIEYRIYDIFEINEVLFTYGEQILC